MISPHQKFQLFGDRAARARSRKMPLPPAAEIARAAAMASQRRQNLGGAFGICSFVAGVLFYTTRVAVIQDEITDEEVARFRLERAQEQRAQEAAARR